MGGFLAGLDAFVVSAAYLGVLFITSTILRPFLTSVLGAAPVVGGWLSSHVDEGLRGFEAEITPRANVALGVVIDILNWLTAIGRGFTATLIQLADAVEASLRDLRSLDLPHAISLAEAVVGDWIAAAKAEALGLVQAAESRAGTLFEALRLQGQALVLAARGEALGLFHAAEHDVELAVGRVEGLAHDLFLAAEHDAAMAVKVVEQDIGAAVQAERQFAVDQFKTLEDAISAGFGLAQTELVEAGGNLRKEFEAELEKMRKSRPAEAAIFEFILGEIEKTPQWRELVAITTVGEHIIATASGDLAAAAMKGVRDELLKAEEFRAKAEPFLREFRAAFVKAERKR